MDGQSRNMIMKSSGSTALARSSSGTKRTDEPQLAWRLADLGGLIRVSQASATRDQVRVGWKVRACKLKTCKWAPGDVTAKEPAGAERGRAGVANRAGAVS